MGEQDAAIREIEKDLTGRLFAQYESRSKSFRTTFSWLLAFAGFFLVFVVLPFMSIQYELRTLPQEIARLKTEIEVRAAAADAVSRSHDGFVRLQEEIRGGPGRLRRYLIETRQNYAQVIDSWKRLQAGPDEAPPIDTGQLAPYSQTGPAEPNNAMAPLTDPLQGAVAIPPSCVAVAEALVMSCLVAEQSRQLFAGYRDTLETEVLQPLETAGLLDRVGAKRASLSGGLDQLEQRLNERLADKPDFWHSVDEKSSFFQAVGSEMEELWGGYDGMITALSGTLQDEQVRLRETEAALAVKRDEMSALREEFKSRLDEIETPFGQLPVGLNEALLGFPVLLAVGFLVCVVQLADARRLRAAFSALYRRSDPSGAVVGEREIALVAPLWPARERRWSRLLLPAPFLVFVLAVAVVLYSARTTDSFRAVGLLSLRIFLVLYAVSLIAFAAALWHAFKPTVPDR
ncbi:MAG: hypothetical protein ACREEV_07560 [Dongiaceae bacterium]